MDFHNGYGIEPGLYLSIKTPRGFWVLENVIDLGEPSKWIAKITLKHGLILWNSKDSVDFYKTVDGHWKPVGRRVVAVTIRDLDMKKRKIISYHNLRKNYVKV